MLERLKVDRALTNKPLGLALAAAPSMIKSGAHLRLMTDQDDRDTLPPSAPITGLLPPPPEGTSTLEEIAHNEDPENWAGYNESLFMHRATKAVINGTNELLKARQIWDIEAIVKRQSLLFQEALEPKFQGLAARLDNDIGNLRTEFEAMKVRMGQIEIALGIRSK